MLEKVSKKEYQKSSNVGQEKNMRVWTAILGVLDED